MISDDYIKRLKLELKEKQDQAHSDLLFLPKESQRLLALRQTTQALIVEEKIQEAQYQYTVNQFLLKLLESY